MRPARKRVLALLLVLALIAVAGCGEEETTEAEEGVPVELGDLEFNIQLTRFLNPTDPEDSEYLAGQEVPTPAGKSYLAVFMTIENRSDDEVTLPTTRQMKVVDTTDATYEALLSSTDFAVPLGSVIPGDGEVPEPGTAGASGPTQGGIVVFLVDAGIPENRPLDLEIAHDGETGTVTLDI
jgi:hypothetical protein